MFVVFKKIIVLVFRNDCSLHSCSLHLSLRTEGKTHKHTLFLVHINLIFLVHIIFRQHNHATVSTKSEITIVLVANT